MYGEVVKVHQIVMSILVLHYSAACNKDSADAVKINCRMSSAASLFTKYNRVFTKSYGNTTHTR